MQLTSKEQALLTVALDAYIKGAPSELTSTEDMWGDLYDEVVSADIDDVGEEYDPNEPTEGELEWDAYLIAAWARDLEDGEGAKECAEAVSECLTDETAWALYHGLNARFDAEFERQAEEDHSEWAQQQLDIEDAISGVNVDVDTVAKPAKTKKVS